MFVCEFNGLLVYVSERSTGHRFTKAEANLIADTINQAHAVLVARPGYVGPDAGGLRREYCIDLFYGAGGAAACAGEVILLQQNGEVA